MSEADFTKEQKIKVIGSKMSDKERTFLFGFRQQLKNEAIQNSENHNIKIIEFDEQRKMSWFEEYVYKNNGTIIEIAGPSSSGYSLPKNIEEKLRKKAYVSNLLPGYPIFSPFTGKKLAYVEGVVDFVANAKKLPFSNDSVQILISMSYSSLKMFEESERVLKPGGLLIVGGPDYKKLSNLLPKRYCFKPVFAFVEKDPISGFDYETTVFEKNNISLDKNIDLRKNITNSLKDLLAFD